MNPVKPTVEELMKDDMLCSVCKSDDRVKFLTITDCCLCSNCRDELSESFEQAMAMDREDYPEL